MFSANTYIQRRKKLSEKIGEGLILFPANEMLPSNFPKNTFPFRQDSTFLYYCGIDIPGIFITVNTETHETILYGNENTMDDTIWTGAIASLQQLAEKAGINKVIPLNKMEAVLQSNKVHYLLPYQKEIELLLAQLFSFSMSELSEKSSSLLLKSVIEQRLIKEEQEISQIEDALNSVSIPMHLWAMQHAKTGEREADIVSRLHQKAIEQNVQMAFQPICSVRGEVLHNTTYLNTLAKGQLLLIDAGAENKMHYASDITRTTPVDGKFNRQQREIYSIVLKAQTECIKAIKAGVLYHDIHFLAARIITQGLIDLKIFHCSQEDALTHNLHTLVFPHGIGHMLGLDVHDMENLGEDNVGYDKTISRSADFGTANLRLAKKVETNTIVTVEPGIYFIPALIEKWKSEKIFPNWINYELLKSYYYFGGIRIEDTVLVQDSDAKVLGKKLPKTISEIETICS